MAQEEEKLNSLANAGGQGDVLKRQELLHALDVEIEQIHQSHQRPGWSKWAILGALAPTIWLFIKVIEEEKFNFKLGVFAFLTITTVLILLNLLKVIIKTDKLTGTKQNRFMLLNDSPDSNYIIFLHLIRIIIILYFGYLCSEWMPQYLPVLFYIIYGVGFLFAVFYLIFALFEIPVPSNSEQNLSKKSGNILMGLAFIGVLAVTAGLLKTYHMKEISYDMVSFRFGGLLWVLSFLLLKLETNTSAPRLLEPLVELRRDLLFNRIDLLSAEQQLDIILGGLKASDLLQQEMGALLKLYNKIFKDLFFVKENLSATRKLLGEDLDSVDIEKIKESLKIVKLSYNESAQNVKDLRREGKKMKVRMGRIILFNPKIREDYYASLSKSEGLINSIVEVSEYIRKEGHNLETELVKVCR